MNFSGALSNKNTKTSYKVTLLSYWTLYNVIITSNPRAAFPLLSAPALTLLTSIIEVGGDGRDGR